MLDVEGGVHDGDAFRSDFVLVEEVVVLVVVVVHLLIPGFGLGFLVVEFPVQVSVDLGCGDGG